MPKQKLICEAEELTTGEWFQQHPQTVVAALEREFKLPRAICTLGLLAASLERPIQVDRCLFWVSHS